MNDVKPWYQSKTIWASIVSLVAVIAAAFGVNIDESMQTAFVEAALQFVAVGGALIAVIGRLSATSMIE
ncbi:MAG: hypothetical protein ACR2O8_09075 [Rhizobiaceae bacterium]